MVRTLPTAVSEAIAGQEIWPVRLVELVVGDTTYRISDHYRDLSIGVDVYLPNGTLLNIDNVTDKTAADNDSIELSLSAIDTSFRGDVIQADATGGSVTIYRGLINSSTGDLVADPITLYRGVIFSVSIEEQRPDSTAAFDRATITAVADVRAITFRLDENPGRFTSVPGFRAVNANDRSGEFVAGLDGRNLRFGGSA